MGHRALPGLSLPVAPGVVGRHGRLGVSGGSGQYRHHPAAFRPGSHPVGPCNLLYFNLPFANGQPFDPSLWGLIFGVILLAFFGHMSVNNCAQVVLRRDASARSLIGGAVAAQVVVIVLYSIWCLAVAGAVLRRHCRLKRAPSWRRLASSVGPIAVVLSSIFVILALAIGSLHSSLGLYNLVRERLPAQASLSVRLPVREGRLVLTPRRSIRDLFRTDRRPAGSVWPTSAWTASPSHK